MVSKIGCGAMLFILSIWFGLMCAMATWTDRTLEFWLSYWCDKTVIIDWWLSCLASLLLPFVFVANVVSEIAMKCV